jgi:hypothetical protein
MPNLGQQIAMRRTIAPQAIGDDPPRLVLEARQQTLEEASGGRGIAPILDQDVEYDAVLIDCAPEILQISVDLQEHLIEVPDVAWPRPALAQLGGEISPEAETPAADALVADDNTPLGQDQLDVAQAQAEQVVEPDGVLDDLDWEAVPGVPDGSDGISSAWLRAYPTRH